MFLVFLLYNMKFFKNCKFRVHYFSQFSRHFKVSKFNAHQTVNKLKTFKIWIKWFRKDRENNNPTTLLAF